MVAEATWLGPRACEGWKRVRWEATWRTDTLGRGTPACSGKRSERLAGGSWCEVRRVRELYGWGGLGREALRETGEKQVVATSLGGHVSCFSWSFWVRYRPTCGSGLCTPAVLQGARGLHVSALHGWWGWGQGLLGRPTERTRIAVDVGHVRARQWTARATPTWMGP